MGGGSKVKQTNPAQAAAANAGATTAANTAADQGQTFSTQQQQLYNMLWGKPTGTGGMTSSGGAVGSFLNPGNLNVSSPTGVFALQNTNANDAAAAQYGQNAGNITAAAQQAGFGPGTPSGFVADQQNKNARALADTKGSNFLNSTQANYNANLNNFWKAADLASGGSQAAGAGANQAQGTAANTYANLYGTAGHGNVVQNPNYLQTGLQAAGTAGTIAACCAEGTLIRTGLKEFTAIEKLFEGATVFGLPEEDDDPIVIKRPLAYAMKPCVRIRTREVEFAIEGTPEGHELICSEDHTLLLPGGGYVSASESLNCSVRTRRGAEKVIAVEGVGERRVVRLHLDAPHVFESNGLLSEE